MTAPTRAVLYARVSNDDRGVEGRNLESQLDLGRHYAAEHNYDLVAELSEDDRGASGAAFELPQLGRIYELAGQGAFDVLVVRELDRLSRKLEKQLMVERLLQDAGVAIEYVLYPYPDTPEGRLALLMRATIAEYERLKTRERTMRGRINVIRQGKVILHGQPPPYGYRVEDGTLAPDEAQAAVVRQIYHWYVHGDEEGRRMGSLRIAKRLTAEGIPTWQQVHPVSKGVTDGTQKQAGWAPAVVRNLIRKPLYIGRWHYGADAELLEVPSIVDEATWQAAQRQLRRQQELASRNEKHQYLMSRRLICDLCDSTVYSFTSSSTRNGKTRRYHFYACAARRGGIANRTCDLPYFRAHIVDDAVWQFVRGVIADPDTRHEVLAGDLAGQHDDRDHLQRRLATIDEDLASAQRKLKRLLRLYLDGRFDADALAEEQAAIDAEIHLREEERTRLTEHQASEAERAARRQRLTDLIDTYRDQLAAADADFTLRRAIVEALDVRAHLGLDGDTRAVKPYFA